MPGRPNGRSTVPGPEKTRLPVARLAAAFLAVVPWLAPVGLAQLGLAQLRPALAQESQEQLESVERALAADREKLEALERQQSAIADEVAALQAELVAKAAEAQAIEKTLTELDAELAALTERERATSAELGQRRRQLASSLGALGWLAMQPPALLLIDDGDATDRLRGATLVAIAVPALQDRAQGLKRELADLETLRQEIALSREATTRENEALAAANARISALVEERSALETATAAERQAQAERVAGLAAEAADLKELLEKLATMVPTVKPAPAADAAGVQTAALASPPAPGTMRDFPAAPGGAMRPAEGGLKIKFGATGADGAESRGITVATRPGARVVAPFDGRVVFQGPFRGYGPILIIEHGGGYHTLLAGLGRIDADVGQWVKEGEPVGQMSPDAGSTSPNLYVELRKDGQPIDPAPWLGFGDN